MDYGGFGGGFAASEFLFVRTYAVGALSLRQSGTLFVYGMRFFRAERGKTAYTIIKKYLAAAGNIHGFRKPNSATA